MSTLLQRFGNTLLGDWIFSAWFYLSCWVLSLLSALAMIHFEWDTRTMVFIIVAFLVVGWCSYFATFHIERLRAAGDEPK